MPKLVPVTIGLAISGLALFLVLESVDLVETGRLLAEADPLPLAATLIVVAAQFMLRTLRWRLLLQPFSTGRELPMSHLAPVLLVGYLGNSVLPARLGEPIRAVLVARRERIGLPEALGSVALERIIDVATLGVVVLAATLLVGAPAWAVQATALAAGLGTSLVALLALGNPASLVRFAHRLPSFGHSRQLEVTVEHLARFVTALGQAHRGGTIVVIAGVSSLAWLLDATTFWLVARSLDIELPPAAVVLIAGVTVLGTAIPSAPGYVGTFELAAASVAVALGVSRSAALGLALLAHAVTLLPLALGGGLSMVAMGVGVGEFARAADSTGAPTTSQAGPGSC